MIGGEILSPAALSLVVPITPFVTMRAIRRLVFVVLMHWFGLRREKGHCFVSTDHRFGLDSSPDWNLPIHGCALGGREDLNFLHSLLSFSRSRAMNIITSTGALSLSLSRSTTHPFTFEKKRTRHSDPRKVCGRKKFVFSKKKFLTQKQAAVESPEETNERAERKRNIALDIDYTRDISVETPVPSPFRRDAPHDMSSAELFPLYMRTRLSRGQRSREIFSPRLLQNVRSIVHIINARTCEIRCKTRDRDFTSLGSYAYCLLDGFW